MLDLSQEELKLLVSILIHLNYKLEDARIIIPLADKIRKEIIEEPVKEDNGTQG